MNFAFGSAGFEADRAGLRLDNSLGHGFNQPNRQRVLDSGVLHGEPIRNLQGSVPPVESLPLTCGSALLINSALSCWLNIWHVRE